jgi:hypothetical protein
MKSKRERLSIKTPVKGRVYAEPASIGLQEFI